MCIFKELEFPIPNSPANRQEKFPKSSFKLSLNMGLKKFKISSIKWPQLNRSAHLLTGHAKSVFDFEAWVEETPSCLEVAIASDVAVCT